MCQEAPVIDPSGIDFNRIFDNWPEKEQDHASQLQCGVLPMSRTLKTATLPSLRVEPEFRDKAESVLNEGETLSAFMEAAVRKQVEIRKSQAEFIARGLAAREESKRTGIYYSADEVLAELKSMLDAKLAEDKKQ